MVYGGIIGGGLRGNRGGGREAILGWQWVWGIGNVGKFGVSNKI